MRRIWMIVFCLLTGAPLAALAQCPSDWEVAPRCATLLPGQSVVVDVLVFMSPVTGFADAVFDLHATTSTGGIGIITLTPGLNSNLNIFGQNGTVVGNSVLAIHGFQLCPIQNPSFDPSNPMFAYRFTYTNSTSQTMDVGFRAAVTSHTVWNGCTQCDATRLSNCCGGRMWRLRAGPGTGPVALYGVGMAFDEGTGQTILFGGTHPAQGWTQNQTWEWNGSSWAQTFPNPSPSERELPAMAYDSLCSDEVVLHGGADLPSPHLDDTWMYNSTTDKWTQLAVNSTGRDRYRHTLTADPVTGRLVLHGGAGPLLTNLRDTWEFSMGSWIQRQSLQFQRSQHAAATFTGSKPGVCIFGGSQNQNAGPWAANLRRWDGVAPAPIFSWLLAPTFGPKPSKRSFHAMGGDTICHEIVLFGGTPHGANYGSTLHDTWVYDGSGWNQVAFSTHPQPRYMTTMVYDSWRDEFVLYGGSGGPGVGGDTWVAVRCPFDVNKDWEITSQDIIALLNLPPNSPCIDLNGDGAFNTQDFVVMINAIGNPSSVCQ